MRNRIQTIVLAPVLLAAVVSTSAEQMPPALVTAALDHYPPEILCEIALGKDFAFPTIPLAEDAQRGWLNAKVGRFTPAGNDYAIVSYTRMVYNMPPARHRPIPKLKIFAFDGAQWAVAPIAGMPDYASISGSFGQDINLDKDVLFTDLDGDGVNELVIYGHAPGRLRGAQEDVTVFALRAGVLVPVTEIAVEQHEPMSTKPSACQYTTPEIGPSDAFVSDTGVGFVDLDGDGVKELLVYPNLGGDRPEDDMQHGRYYDVPTTGTRVYKLVNGVYALQYETPVGSSGMPPIGGAIKPASVPSSELDAVGKSGGGGKDEAISIYFMPPAKLTLAEVDWASLRVGDFKIAPTADGGDAPAPHSATETTTWTPLAYLGQSLLLEQLSDKQQGNFDQSTKDPVIYMGVKGRLHFTTPFHELRFSKKALFGWLLAQWQKGGGNQQLKGCLAQGNHQRCFTPISLPVKVNLKGSNAFAMGEAMLWVETKE